MGVFPNQAVGSKHIGVIKFETDIKLVMNQNQISAAQNEVINSTYALLINPRLLIF